jgi:hypothetical protein
MKRLRDRYGKFCRTMRVKAKFDLTGKTFAQLLVLEHRGFQQRGRSTERLWKCRCTCGNIKFVGTSALKHGNTKSCGCLHIEEATKRCRERITHGHTVRDEQGRVSSEYTAYCSARQRCRDPKIKRWLNYGGANPPVRFLWTSFQQFLDEVGCKPVVAGVRYSLGRKNDTGNYGPGCGNTWMTDSEQIAARYAKRNGFYTSEQQTKAQAA